MESLGFGRGSHERTVLPRVCSVCKRPPRAKAVRRARRRSAARRAETANPLDSRFRRRHRWRSPGPHTPRGCLRFIALGMAAWPPAAPCSAASSPMQITTTPKSSCSPTCTDSQLSAGRALALTTHLDGSAAGRCWLGVTLLFAAVPISHKPAGSRLHLTAAGAPPAPMPFGGSESCARTTALAVSGVPCCSRFARSCATSTSCRREKRPRPKRPGSRRRSEWAVGRRVGASTAGPCDDSTCTVGPDSRP